MLAFIFVGGAAALSLRHNEKSTTSALKLDPHCSEGIMNTEMTVCCMKDCGECSDTSNFCSESRQAEKGVDPQGRESTCCPSHMTEVPSCSVSMAPCAIPEEVRNPPSLDSLKAAEVHAKDDCGEVIKATSDSNHLSTAYVKFPEKGVRSDATTKDCGTYGTLVQAAAACSNDDDCFGFNAKPDGDATKPDCLYVASTSIEKTSDTSGQDLYLKVEDQYTGKKFNLRMGPCSKKCGGGTRVPVCMSESGTTSKLGICSALVAMNADAELEEQECHKHTCDPSKVDEAEVTSTFKKCFQDQVTINPNYYYDWHFMSDGRIKTRNWYQRNMKGDGYYDLAAYGGEYEADKIVFTPEEIAGTPFRIAEGGVGPDTDRPFQATFSCKEQGESTDVSTQWELFEPNTYYFWDGTYEFNLDCACAEE